MTDNVRHPGMIISRSTDDDDQHVVLFSQPATPFCVNSELPIKLKIIIRILSLWYRLGKGEQ